MESLNSRREYLGKFRNVLVLFTCIFAVTALGVYISFAIYGETLLRYIDGLYQNYPLLVKTKSIFSDLFHGRGFSFWSWQLGLGVDSIAAYESRIFNPLMLLAACFPVKYLDLGYSFAVVVGEYIAGISFLVFSRKYGYHHVQSLIGAVCYSFCGWVVYSSSHQLSFLTAAIILPLLLLGVEKILKKESPLPFMILVGISLVLSFYWSYMCAIIVILYYLIKVWTSPEKKSWKAFFPDFGRFVFYGIVGILLSAPVLIPRFILLTNASTGASSETELLYSLRTYLNFIPGIFTGNKVNESYSFASVSSLCILMVPMAFRRLKEKSIASIFFVICIVMALVPFFGSLFNGLSYVTGRWMFIFAFFFVLATVECYVPEIISKSRNLAIMGITFAALSAWSIFVGVSLYGKLAFSGWQQFAVAVCFGALLLLVMCFTRKNERRRNGLVIVLLVCNIVLFHNAEFAVPNSTGNNGFVGLAKSYKAYEAAPSRVTEQLQDEDFYRVDTVNGVRKKTITGTMANEGIYYNYNPINIYQSTLNGDWTKLNKATANSCGNFFRTGVYSNDNRPGLNLLTGVKYFLGKNNGTLEETMQYAGYGYEPYQQIDGVPVLKNKYHIGLGTLYDSYMTESDFMELPTLKKEEALLQTAIVPDEETALVADLPRMEQQDIESVIRQVDYTLSEGQNLIVEDGTIAGGTQKGSVHMEVRTEEAAYIYLVLDGVEKEVSKKNLEIGAGVGSLQKAAINAEGSSFGFSDVDEYIINLGYYQAGTQDIEITFNQKFSCQQFDVYVMPVDLYEESAQKLVDNRIQVTSWQQDLVEGEITAEEDGIAYFSIPNNPWWSVYIDGEKVESISDLNIAFTGAYVSEGQHSVVLKYSCKGFVYGFFLFAVGALCCIAVGIRFHKTKRGRKKA